MTGRLRGVGQQGWARGDARSRWLALVVAMLAGLVLACAEEQPASTERAPISPHAAWLLEPPQLGVGQITNLELAVVTPPGYTVEPYRPPPVPPGLELLASETLDVERQGARWIHRTRLRLRATATGARVWPAGAVGVEGPGGDAAELPLPEHPIEIVSVLPEYPDRVTPFGARAPVLAEGRATPFWAPALFGAATALASVALVALARRRRRADARAAAVAETPAGPSAGERARSQLDVVRSRSEAAPFDAAHELSLALRRFVDARFGADTAGRCIEELREGAAPFTARSRWPALLEILSGLDELRFRPDSDAAARDALAARLAGLIERADRFVEDAEPQGSPR